ncbi:hypothetical protein B0A48_06415 [Cryoendolithus antarcticus]|uniref:Acid phosphatase n=1 Tax=Cryoendolithus antarcticus TaxID=1507870 RepID=A0A1V8TAZ2_9PEZI|nr:hypothetical protein B0A48_06415 [Cryoendolithus antarcticus]
MNGLFLAGLAVGAAAQANIYTSTKAVDVAAAAATATTTSPTSDVKGRVFDRFVTIWLENTDYSKASADPNLLWLASQGITLTNYFGVTHPSEPNYVAAVGGDNFGMDNDNFNQIDANVSTIVDVLEDRGISWSTYQEDMPYSGFEGMGYVNQNTKSNDYVRKHHPTILYNANTTPQRLSQQKNLTMFYQDLAAGKLPQWMFITPNMTSDGHDTSVTTAGTWTRAFLEPLLADKKSSFWKKTLVLITFDENHTYTTGNRVFSILLGDSIKNSKVGSTDAHYYNHYSEIATVEANWDLHTLGRWDVGANVFKNVGDRTGDHIRDDDSVTSLLNATRFLNSSYAGPFNTGFQKAAYPAPNTGIQSPHSLRTVLPAIAAAWQGSKASFYTAGSVINDGQHPPAGYARNPA